MGGNLLSNYGEAIAMILFGIGFSNLLLQKNLIKKIIGLNIMDTAVYLFLADKGFIMGAHRSGRNPGGGELYQSGAQRAGAHGNRGFRIRYGADALPHHPAVPQVPYAGFG